jgi:hypothetical protein
MVDPTVLAEIIAQMADEGWRIRTAAIDTVLRLAGYGMNRLRINIFADCPSDDTRSKIIESNVLSQIIAMLKDSDSDVRAAAIEAIFSLASHGMNLL